MLVECGQLKIKTNRKAMNKDPVWLNVGSCRRFSQPNLKSRTLKCYIYDNSSGYHSKPSSGLDVTEL